MKSNLYLLKFNNYFNRKLIYHAELSDYPSPIKIVQATNFECNDELTTQQVINYRLPDIDYLLVVVDEQITSRWFILKTELLSAGQYKLYLRRDVLADNYDIVINAPCFIEKATLRDDDQLIYNSENMTVNQIKTNETLLKDNTSIPWIIGYYSQTEKETGYYIKDTFNDSFPYDILISDTLENWEYYKYITTAMVGPLDPINYITKIRTDQTDVFALTLIRCFSTNKYGTSHIDQPVLVPPTTGYYNSDPTDEMINNAYKDNLSMFDTTLKDQTFSKTQEEVNDLLSLNGKLLKFQNGSGGFKYYKVKIDQYSTKSRVIKPNSVLEKQMHESLYFKGIIDTYNDDNLEIDLGFNSYKIEIQEVIPGTYNYEIANSAYKLTDSPYSMFAIPYGVIDIYNNGSKVLTTNKDLAFKIAMDIAKKYPSVVYDIQLLPYNPILQLVQEDGTCDLKGDNALFSYITKDSANVGIILNASVSSFTINISNTIETTNKKISNECDMYRLVSPNYNGQFEFSVAKNNGVALFNIDCTYKPYSPYIHINPDFKNLYGQDFNDARGLICGGDFSLPVVTDQWSQYQINNKNYQNIFDRQIQNMEFKNDYQRFNEQVGIGMGTLTAGITGGVIGSKAGPIGTGIGAIGGMAAGLTTGLIDLQRSDSMRKETMDYTKDLFGYQLGNIKALPNSLSKTTAYTYNNKIFPIVECYTCTDREKETVANKISWNGMTVMSIGTINKYINNSWSYGTIEDKGYIKGKIIRLDGVYEYVVAVAISSEIDMGVYLK